MSRKLRGFDLLLRFIGNWPFLTLGLFTFGLFLIVELGAEGFQQTAVGRGLVAALSVLILPIWLMRYFEVFVGMGYLPVVLQVFIALPLLFAPYVVVDLLIRELRHWLASGARTQTVQRLGINTGKINQWSRQGR